MTHSVDIHDETYEKARQEADQRDISIGAVIQSWRKQADAYTHTTLDHRLAGAEPTTPREDAPRDESGDPENL